VNVARRSFHNGRLGIERLGKAYLLIGFMAAPHGSEIQREPVVRGRVVLVEIDGAPELPFASGIARST